MKKKSPPVPPSSTFGKKAYDLIYSEPERQDPIQTQQEMLQKVEDEIWKTVDAGRKKIINKNFYVVMSTKKDPVYPNLYTNLYWYRASCPTPTYDNNVWVYHVKDDTLEELWVLPDKETVELYYLNPLAVDPSEYTFLNYVMAFKNGDLDKKCRQLNKEKENDPNVILIPQA